MTLFVIEVKPESKLMCNASEKGKLLRGWASRECTQWCDFSLRAVKSRPQKSVTN